MPPARLVPLDSYVEMPLDEMRREAEAFLERMRRRRTVRDFSDRPVARDVIDRCLLSVAFQAMLHLQVVTGLAPPKGMNLPFIWEGGSALVASCLAVGLALGAVRSPVRARSRG